MNSPNPAWHRYFLYRKETWRTTWTFRLLVLLLFVVIGALVWKFSTVPIAQSLVCTESAPHSDAILVENFDPDYVVFERAEALRESGIAARIFVPTMEDANPRLSNSVSTGIAEVMARIARLPNFEIIPIREAEPISLNAAMQIRNVLLKEEVRSVVVVTPGFRSRRSALVYNRVFAPAGISVGCVPAFGAHTPQNWSQSWHGVQDIVLQFVKLQYYRFYVLR